MLIYDFKTTDDQGRKGGTKYRVNGKDVIFRQDFKGGFGPGTGDIKICNGDGRWAQMTFIPCRCNNLCHGPGPTSDARVTITEKTQIAGCDKSSIFDFFVEFQPIAAVDKFDVVYVPHPPAAAAAAAQPSYMPPNPIPRLGTKTTTKP